MAKKANAANITHGLAQIGGGSKKEGGGGMMAGVQKIFETGVNYGAQQAISGNQTSKELNNPIPLLIDDDKKA